MTYSSDINTLVCEMKNPIEFLKERIEYKVTTKYS